jgi:hypothetical protein
MSHGRMAVTYPQLQAEPPIVNFDIPRTGATPAPDTVTR